MQLTISLLNRFVEEIISYHDYKQFEDKQLAELIAAVDSEERFWHVEGSCVWKIASWRDCQVNVERRAALSLKENEVFTSRKDAHAALTQSVMDMFGADRKLAHKFVLNILHSKNNTKAQLLGIDISKLEEPNKPYIIIDKELGEYRL